MPIIEQCEKCTFLYPHAFGKKCRFNSNNIDDVKEGMNNGMICYSFEQKKEEEQVMPRAEKSKRWKVTYSFNGKFKVTAKNYNDAYNEASEYVLDKINESIYDLDEDKISVEEIEE
jgi:hypothetical protein